MKIAQALILSLLAPVALALPPASAGGPNSNNSPNAPSSPSSPSWPSGGNPTSNGQNGENGNPNNNGDNGDDPCLNEGQGNGSNPHCSPNASPSAPSAPAEPTETENTEITPASSPSGGNGNPTSNGQNGENGNPANNGSNGDDPCKNSGNGNGANLENNPNCNPTGPAGSKGDPHFKTWVGEHFEYHGQCDLVLAQDAEFSDGLGIGVQIRTKLVRYWSYITRAAVRIGEDILEVGGEIDKTDGSAIYWFNFVYQGEAPTIGGFPLTIYDDQVPGHPKRRYEIDLSSKYPGQMISIKTFKEFVRIDFVNASEESFGNTVGMMGDFKTGKTFGRDGSTVFDDFLEFGAEWQVRPSDNMLFNDLSDPQFPKRCVLPEDPRGERRRRLEESSVSIEAAEKACASLTDELDRKECVYDIIATQDLDMAGAY